MPEWILRQQIVTAAMTGATWLAGTQAADDEPFLDPIFAGVDELEQRRRIERAADMLAMIGSSSGEIMFRWMHQAGYHHVPVEAWAHWRRLHPLKLWFELMAALLTTLRPVMEGPPPPAHQVVTPPSQPNDDNVYTERVGQQFERVYDRGMTTAGVVVAFPPAAPGGPQTVGEMFRGEGRRLPQAAIDAMRADAMAKEGERAMPTSAEMAAMSVEERRAYIHLDPRFGGGARGIETQAPPIDSYQRETVQTLHGPATVYVPRTGPRPPMGTVEGPRTAACTAVEAGAGPSGQGPALLASAEGDAASDPAGGEASPPHAQAEPLQARRRRESRPGAAAPLTTQQEVKHDDET
jgi:hypothetical protein